MIYQSVGLSFPLFDGLSMYILTFVGPSFHLSVSLFVPRSLGLSAHQHWQIINKDLVAGVRGKFYSKFGGKKYIL